MQCPVTDLHCDMLLYLQHDDGRTPFDTCVRCAIPQMRNGRVKMQIMALFAETEKGSAELGLKQADVFKVLANRYPEDFEQVQTADAMSHVLLSSKIGIMAAVEKSRLV